MKAMKLLAAGVALASFPAWATVPTVSNVHMSQPNGTREVTITYNLDAAAVVTLDIQTNATANAAADDPGWTSIGGEGIWNAYGDVWKKVNAEGGASFSGTIKWRPDLSWPDYKILGNGARAKLTAWSLNNTPDFMVVHLDVANAEPNYYPAKEFLPGSEYGQKGAITNNPAYKTTKLLMRKIMAAGVQWTMGSTESECTATTERTRETTHLVTLTNNYYIGVFEITQKQWKMVWPDSAATAYHTADGEDESRAGEHELRPMEQVSYNEIRNSSNTTAVAGNQYPNPPNDDSFLGRLRALTDGINFDLPSEAQWEFACRAGNGDGLWGNGQPIKQTVTQSNRNSLSAVQLGLPGRCGLAKSNVAVEQGGTSIVGTYAPNSWDIYDMHGNVWELCLDKWQNDVSSLAGAVVTGMNDTSGTLAATRGAGYNSYASRHRSAYRDAMVRPSVRDEIVGFRVICTTGLN